MAEPNEKKAKLISGDIEKLSVQELRRMLQEKDEELAKERQKNAEELAKKDEETRRLLVLEREKALDVVFVAESIPWESVVDAKSCPFTGVPSDWCHSHHLIPLHSPGYVPSGLLEYWINCWKLGLQKPNPPKDGPQMLFNKAIHDSLHRGRASFEFDNPEKARILLASSPTASSLLKSASEALLKGSQKNTRAAQETARASKSNIAPLLANSPQAAATQQQQQPMENVDWLLEANKTCDIRLSGHFRKATSSKEEYSEGSIKITGVPLFIAVSLVLNVAPHASSQTRTHASDGGGYNEDAYQGSMFEVMEEAKGGDEEQETGDATTVCSSNSLLGSHLAREELEFLLFHREQARQDAISEWLAQSSQTHTQLPEFSDAADQL